MYAPILVALVAVAVSDIGLGPLLLGCQSFQTSPKQAKDQFQDFAVHPDEDQVQRDVARAFVHYPKSLC